MGLSRVFPSARNAFRFGARGVYLTGNTLEASLKMRCETSGAGYAIYWSKVGNDFVVAGDYVTPARRAALLAQGKSKSYAVASEGVRLPADGKGPVATTYKTGESRFIADASSAGMQRQKLVDEYGIASICFMPFEDGVLEYGTSKGPCTANWNEMPDCPVMPKKEMRRAFENHGAKYVIFWAEKDGNFSAVADYVTPERVRAMRAARGDDKTFASESRGLKLPTDGNGPVATAARTGEQVHIKHAADEKQTLRRHSLAKEFGIDEMYFLPVEGGVLEYGIPKDNKLTGNLLSAALKMRTDTSGAGYAIYWTEVDGYYTVAGDYVTPARRAALKAQGKTGTFAEASESYKLDASGDVPVATVARTGKPHYIPDAMGCPEMKRGDLAKEFGVNKIALIPVEGGVLEYGTSVGPCTADWGSEMPACPDMPKAEMKTALDNGAVFFIFHKRVGDDFVVGADFVIPERASALRQIRGDDKTYASESRRFKLPANGSGYVATAARSGKAQHCLDIQSDTKLLRCEIAKEFGIRELHFVPCRDGVLEYGVASVA